MGFGVSFLGDDDDESGGRAQQFQKAVEILSMRVPKVVGGGAMAPAPLLQGMGGGSPFGGDSAMAQAFAQMAGIPPPQAPQAQPQQQAMMAPQRPAAMPMRPPQQPRQPPPMPRIIPGIEQTGAPPPVGNVGREWAPPPAPEQGFTAGNGQPGELLTAAERASRGYNDPTSAFQQMMRQKWSDGSERGLF